MTNDLKTMVVILSMNVPDVKQKIAIKTKQHDLVAAVTACASEGPTKQKIVIKVKPRISTLDVLVPAVKDLENGGDIGAYPRKSDKPLIISFDVGIINLAYCVMDHESNIIDWNIICMADGDSKLTCCAKTLQGKPCTKLAYYLVTNTDTDTDTDTDKNIPLKTKGRKKQKQAQGLCVIHGKNKGLPRNMTVDNVSELELKMHLFKHLDQHEIFSRPKVIVIETQPPEAREKIRGIGHAIFDYYVLRKMDGRLPFDEIKFIDAKNKLTVYDGPAISCHLKDPYGRNKWYGRKHCHYFIKNNATDLSHFEAFKKKDDLADCYLQGRWYLTYGKHNTKAPVTQSHCAARYELNIIQYQKGVKPRAPGPKVRKYTMPNIKYFLGNNRQHKDKMVPNMEILESSICFFFGSREYFDSKQQIVTQ